MQRSPSGIPALVPVLTLGVLAFSACIMASTRDPGGSGGATPAGSGGMTGATGSGGSMPSPPKPCAGLECQQTTCTGSNCMVQACPAGKHTTLGGIIYDPAGKVPLYNVNVFVPNAPLDDLAEGVTCDRCDTPVSGKPLVHAQTDAKGAFTLLEPPVGANVPLVIQVGKWRRKISVPSITACMDNVLDNHDLARLPKNKDEGHLPRIALTTGGADALECLLRKIGIDDAEFTPETGNGRVNLFAGVDGTNTYAPTLNAGAMISDAAAWWELGANLDKYDIVLHSCEGTERPTNKSMNARQALLDYANKGGRVFASHWHNYWFEFGPTPLPTVATFNHGQVRSSIVSTIDTTFPKGNALADWLVNVGGSTTRGQLAINGAKHTVDAVNPLVAQRWIYYDTPASVQYLTANTPIGSMADKQCGRVVFSDIHVSSGVGDTSSPLDAFPSGCKTTDLSPQEKALEFMLFDLSSCIVPDGQIP